MRGAIDLWSLVLDSPVPVLDGFKITTKLRGPSPRLRWSGKLIPGAGDRGEESGTCADMRLRVRGSRVATSPYSMRADAYTVDPIVRPIAPRWT